MGEYFLSKERLEYVCKDYNTTTVLNEAKEIWDNMLTTWII